jgi:hypothetical protein
MPDFERRVTVGLDADAAFDLLAEPARLPLWLVGVRLDDSIAVDGDPARQEVGDGAPQAPPARFVVDRHARRVEWAAPGDEYSATLEVKPMLAGMSAVTVRLHARDAVDVPRAEQALDAAVKALGRRLTG